VLCETFGNAAFAMACRVLNLGGVGAEMLPSTAERILSGIETLPLRMQRHTENARAVAAWLSGMEGVRWVSYPGLPGDRHHNLSRRYQPNGAGPIVCFAIDGDASDAPLAGLRLISTQTAQGGTRSTIRRVEKAPGGAMVFRLFVGIEDRDDIVADLERVLPV
jgi:O-acetylhomoserine (thiol)-lyase